mgnify:CR=1 FL=1
MAWVDILNGDLLSDVRTKHNKVGELAYQSTATGFITGGEPSVASGTTIDITAGTGRIVDDYTTPGSPVVTEVSWGAQNGITPTFLNTNGLTRMKFDSAGVLQQQSGAFTDDDYRDFICITNVLHSDFATVTDAGSASFQPIGHATFVQFLNLFGGINFSGNVYDAATSATLAIKRSAGQTWKMGVNYVSSKKDPNYSTSIAEDAVPSIIRVWDDGSGTDTSFTVDTVIDPTVYDDGSGTLNTYGGASTQATNRYLYFFPASGATVVVVGNVVYSSLIDAEAAAESENLDFLPSDFRTEASLRCILSVTKGCTDLTVIADATFKTINTIRIG